MTAAGERTRAAATGIRKGIKMANIAIIAMKNNTQVFILPHYKVERYVVWPWIPQFIALDNTDMSPMRVGLRNMVARGW